jgi:hypothetical protein
MTKLEKRKLQILQELNTASFSGTNYDRLVSELRILKTDWINQEVKPYLEKIGMKYENN